MVFNGGAIMKINGGTSANNIFCVLNNPPVTPIKISGVSDGIIMEDEYNLVQLNLGISTNSVTVPYMSNFLEQITLTLTPTSAGIGNGNIRFSGKVAPVRLTGFDNLIYKPSDVTNMGSAGNSTNNSNMAIDRFWIIDANGYTTKPGVNLNFTYIDAEWLTNSGNTITEGNLRAQRFNNTPTVQDWEGYIGFLPAGTINTTNNTVTNVNVNPADFYRSWTLNDLTKVLPIELLSFEANCENGHTTLNWCTATEKNNNYFTIYSSSDGYSFEPIAIINGAGNSLQKKCYTYKDINSKNTKTIYYKLSQTDFNYTTQSINTIAINDCNKTDNSIIITNNLSHELFVYANSITDSNDEIKIVNTNGQLVFHNEILTKNGFNKFYFNLNHLTAGVYYVSIFRNNDKLSSQKIIITDN